MFPQAFRIGPLSGDVSAAMTFVKPLHACARGLVNKTSESPTISLTTSTIATTTIQDEGNHSCADYSGHHISSLVASDFDTYRARRSRTDSCSTCCSSMELTLRFAYGILPRRHKSNEGTKISSESMSIC
jgi:hypothetical protein